MRKRRRSNNICDQVLSTDYWEGFYILYNGNLVKCTDVDNNVNYIIYDIKNGNVLAEGSLEYNEENTLQKLSEYLWQTFGSKIKTAISKEYDTPDRYSSMESIIESKDPMGIWKVRSLVKRILDRGIPGFGGRMGFEPLYDGAYGGFYLLDNGNILELTDIYEWDQESCDMIYDGMCEYRVYESGMFLKDKGKGGRWGYLKEEYLSDLLEFIGTEYGKATKKLVSVGDQEMDHFKKALEGDEYSAKMIFTLTGIKIHNKP